MVTHGGSAFLPTYAQVSPTTPSQGSLLAMVKAEEEVCDAGLQSQPLARLGQEAWKFSGLLSY